MKSLKLLSSDLLIQETRKLVREELRIGLQVLEYLREIELRSLHLKRGHSSLFSFCILELGYSESQAQLRIDAMRALRDTPEIEEKVKAGALNVTGLVQVQRFLRKERKRTGKVYSSTERLELFQKMEGKSQKEVEKELIEISPQSALPQEKMKPVSADQTELRVFISESLRLGIEELKALYSNRMKDSGSTAELLEILVREALGRKTSPWSASVSTKASDQVSASDTDKNPMRRSQSRTAASPMVTKACNEPKPDQTVAPLSIKVNLKKAQSEQTPIQKLTRYIPAKIKRQVFQRDNGQCTYRDPETGRVCGSKYYLQVDHVMPYSLLGSSMDPENLRLLCGSHNRYAWKR